MISLRSPYSSVWTYPSEPLDTANKALLVYCALYESGKPVFTTMKEKTLRLTAALVSEAVWETISEE